MSILTYPVISVKMDPFYGDDFETIGPSAIIEMKKFLSQHANEYAVDSFYTDFFGYNGTWNMHGYIRKCNIELFIIITNHFISL